MHELCSHKNNWISITLKLIKWTSNFVWQCSHSDSVSTIPLLWVFSFSFFRFDYGRRHIFVCVNHQLSFACFSSGHLFIFDVFFHSLLYFRAHSGETLFSLGTQLQKREKNNTYYNTNNNSNHTRIKIQSTYFTIEMHWNLIKLSLFCCLLFRFNAFLTFFFYINFIHINVYANSFTREREKKIHIRRTVIFQRNTSSFSTAS